MATVIEPRTQPAEAERRFLLTDVGWDGYEAILKIVGDRPIRITYDRGDLEFFMPGRPHERYKHLLGRMIVDVTVELEIPCIGAASTTWRRQDLDRGLEPDECFYLASMERIIDKEELDLTIDPPPDLAIEIDISRSSLDRMGIYAALGVPEIWRFDGKTLRVGRLGEEGTYLPCPSSPALPFLPMDEVVRFLRLAEGMDHSRWGREFRAWVRDELAPRHRGGAGAGA